MLTLHNVISGTKSALKWSGIAFIGFLLILFLINTAQHLKDRYFPKQPPAPTVAFGKLSRIVFPPNVSDKKFTYIVDTIPGTLPQFPDRILVYRITHPSLKLGDLQNAESAVAKLGFFSQETQLSNSLYSWQDMGDLHRTLTLDIVSSDFQLNSSFSEYPSVLNSLNPPTAEKANQLAHDFYKNIQYPSDIDDTVTSVQFFKLDHGKLLITTNPTEQKVVRVDLFQQKVNLIPIYYVYPQYSTMNFFVANNGTQTQVVEANIFHQEIDKTFASTYPLKTSLEAYQELVNGAGYIAQSYDTSSTIKIKTVDLGYYLGNQQQDYLMPIIVFKGDNGFVAYVSAIRDGWIASIPYNRSLSLNSGLK